MKKLSFSTSSIAEIHRRQKNAFASEEEQLPELEKQLQDLQEKYKDIAVGSAIYRQVTELRNRIDSIRNQNNKKQYYANVHKILKKYESDDSSRDELNSQFLRRMGIMDVSKIKESEESEVSELCDICDEEMELLTDDDEYVCHDCGVVRPARPSNDGLWTNIGSQYDSEQQFICYKKINHFLNKWLNQIQSKDIIIPPEVLEGVQYQLKQLRITNPNKIDPKLIRMILKRLEFSKHYNLCHVIVTRLKNEKPPTVNHETEELLKEMFDKLQKPFFEVIRGINEENSKNTLQMTILREYNFKSENGRRNFLSYSYVLRKLCELIGRDDLALIFPVLKSREKLIIQDAIWKGMMKKLNWQYIPSV